jgi:phage gp46-like protein
MPPLTRPPKTPARPKITASTKDWTILFGRLENDDTHASSVQFLLDHHRGSSAAMPLIGSRFHTITKILESTYRTVESMAREALLPLTRPGKISDVVAVAVPADAPGRIKLTVSWRDSRGKPDPVTKILSVGRK